MDDLENRLRDELDAAGRAVAAPASLRSTVRRKVRRRQARTGALAALPVALLVVGAVWILGADDDTADVDVVDTPTPTAPDESLVVNGPVPVRDVGTTASDLWSWVPPDALAEVNLFVDGPGPALCDSVAVGERAVELAFEEPSDRPCADTDGQHEPVSIAIGERRVLVYQSADLPGSITVAEIDTLLRGGEVARFGPVRLYLPSEEEWAYDTLVADTETPSDELDLTAWQPRRWSLDALRSELEQPGTVVVTSDAFDELGDRVACVTDDDRPDCDRPEAASSAPLRRTVTATADRASTLALLWPALLTLNDSAEAAEAGYLMEVPAAAPDSEDSADDVRPPASDALRAALEELGADVDGAPADAATLGDAEWCGLEEVDPSTGALDDAAPSGCLIDATEAGRDAALVRVETTIEGDPIVTVAWTRSALFEASVFIDSSQDSFGTPGWTELRCDLTIDDAAPTALTWQNCLEPSADRLQLALVEFGAAVGTAPPEAMTLGDAEWCGVDGPEMTGDLHDPPEVAMCLLRGDTDPFADRVMVRVENTQDGRIVRVLRWRESLGKVDVYSDESQLSEGISVWSSQHCRLAIEGLGLPAPIRWTDCGPGALDEIDGADDPDDPPYGPGVEIGQTYDYVLTTHCGIEWARIDGVWWRTPTPLDDGNANPPPGWGNPSDDGVMEIIDRTTAIYRGGPDAAVEFKRTGQRESPLSDCD